MVSREPYFPENAVRYFTFSVQIKRTPGGPPSPSPLPGKCVRGGGARAFSLFEPIIFTGRDVFSMNSLYKWKFCDDTIFCAILRIIPVKRNYIISEFPNTVEAAKMLMKEAHAEKQKILRVEVYLFIF